MCRVVHLRTAQASQVAQAVLYAWVYLEGMPISLRTDKSPQFTSKVFESVCGLLGIRHALVV